jgi:hypothetical protein
MGDPVKIVVTKVTCITQPKSTPSGSVVSTAGTSVASVRCGKAVAVLGPDRALFHRPSQSRRYDSRGGDTEDTGGLYGL